MKNKKFKERWEEYTKLDKFGFITFHIILVIFMIWFFYQSYFTKNLLDMFRLNYYGMGNLSWINYFGFITMFVGVWSLSMLFYNLIDKIFYPETKEETKLKKEIKKLYKKNHPILAQLIKSKLIYEKKLRETKEKITKWDKE